MHAPDDNLAEGAELRLRSSGPFPPGALDDIRALVQVAKRAKGLKLRGSQAIEKIPNSVIASALVLADADLDTADAEFAHIETQKQASPPPPPDEATRAVADAAAKLCAAAEAAATDGVTFRVRVPVEVPVG